MNMPSFEYAMYIELICSIEYLIPVNNWLTVLLSNIYLHNDLEKIYGPLMI